MMSKLFIAAAGAGKTTFLTNCAFDQSMKTNKKILVTTFTDDNTLEIQRKIYSKHGFIPSNIDILPWFTFLLKECARPYQQFMVSARISRLQFVKGISAIGIPESHTEDFFFNKEHCIYSDKLANFICKLNEHSEGLVVKRLYKLYSIIYIDEIQDMAGYDFELIRLLHKAGINVIMAGDPRQTISPNHQDKKNKKYFGYIDRYIKDKKLDVEIDVTTLNQTYRNNTDICNFANKFYPGMQPCKSANIKKTGHDGIFILKESQVNQYHYIYRPVVLRDSKKTKVNIHSTKQVTIYNFQKSKGLGFDRVLIFPTKELLQWIMDSTYRLKPKTRAKSYVAVTRARFSVAFVVADKKAEKVSQSSRVPVWIPEMFPDD